MILISKTTANVKYVIRSIRKRGQLDTHNDQKMSTVKTFVTRNRIEPSSDDEDGSNEIMHPINRGHSVTEVNSQDKRSKFNRTGKKTTKAIAPMYLAMTP